MAGQTGIRWTVLGLALAATSGCSMFSGMDGTWVFQWDRSSFLEVSKLEAGGETNSVEGPTCSGSGAFPTRSMDGTTYSYVEIYLTKGTGIVVSMDGQDLVGTVDGSGFDVEAAFEEVIWADDETYDQWEWLLTLEGELAKGEINGTVDFKSIDGYGSPDVSCLYQSRMNYKAVKLTTEGKPDRPTGTDGGGIQNQAEIPSVEDEE